MRRHLPDRNEGNRDGEIFRSSHLAGGHRDFRWCRILCHEMGCRNGKSADDLANQAASFCATGKSKPEREMLRGRQGAIHCVSGLRRGFGKFLFVEPKGYFASGVDVDSHLAAICQLSEEQFVSQRTANGVLNEA